MIATKQQGRVLFVEGPISEVLGVLASYYAETQSDALMSAVTPMNAKACAIVRVLFHTQDEALSGKRHVLSVGKLLRCA